MCRATQSISTFFGVPWVGSSTERVDKRRKRRQRRIDTLTKKAGDRSREPGSQPGVRTAGKTAQLESSGVLEPEPEPDILWRAALTRGERPIELEFEPKLGSEDGSVGSLDRSESTEWVSSAGNVTRALRAPFLPRCSSRPVHLSE